MSSTSRTHLPDRHTAIQKRQEAPPPAAAALLQQSCSGGRAVSRGASLSGCGPLGWSDVLVSVFAETIACCPCRLSCLAVCLALVKRCVLLYGTLPAFHEIARPLRALLTQHLADRHHPRELQVRLPVTRALGPGPAVSVLRAGWWAFLSLGLQSWKPRTAFANEKRDKEAVHSCEKRLLQGGSGPGTHCVTLRVPFCLPSDLWGPGTFPSRATQVFDDGPLSRRR